VITPLDKSRNDVVRRSLARKAVADPHLSVALKASRRGGYWLFVTANGKRISGDLWFRPDAASAFAAKPALLAHWKSVAADVYGSVAAAARNDMAAYS
jgi:hypothetical protein